MSIHELPISHLPVLLITDDTVTPLRTSGRVRWEPGTADTGEDLLELELDVPFGRLAHRLVINVAPRVIGDVHRMVTGG